MIDHELSTDDIAARLAALRQSVVLQEHISPKPEPVAVTDPEPPTPVSAARFKYIKPCEDYLSSWVSWVLDPREHFQLGLEELDQKLRGFRPGEMNLVQGYSASGKSQVLLSAVVANRNRPFVWVSFDETGEMVVAKVVAMLTEASTEELEWGIKARDAKTLKRLRDVAAEELPHLYVIDEPLGTGAMNDALKEAADRSQQEVAAMAIDYLGVISTLKGEREDDKAKELKAWVQTLDLPCFVIHQNSRSGGAPGEPITLTSGRMGGEQEATNIITVRRKRDWKELDDHERHAHRDTVSVGISKNKRSSRLGEHDYFMDPKNGRVLPRHMDPEYIHRSEVVVDERPKVRTFDQILREANGGRDSAE